ncbi:MAG: YmdB family metallophosphoesterase, partial [Patescibacteria group bacterium]
MKILYLGDIMADAGMSVAKELLPELVAEHQPDVVVAQAENVTGGRGMSPEDMDRLQDLGIDFFTGGNWSGYLPELHARLEDKSSPVIGPANYGDCPGLGYKYLHKEGKKVLFVTLLGQIVGRQPENVSNPLVKIDEILEQELAKQTPDAVVVNFHGDYSSEKKIIGHYLDGRVDLVVGDHWHIPTADAMILPKGTAHITDVGMCGSLHSSLGVSLDSVIPRWHDGLQTKNVQDDSKPW